MAGNKATGHKMAGNKVTSHKMAGNKVTGKKLQSIYHGHLGLGFVKKFLNLSETWGI